MASTSFLTFNYKNSAMRKLLNDTNIYIHTAVQHPSLSLKCISKHKLCTKYGILVWWTVNIVCVCVSLLTFFFGVIYRNRPFCLSMAITICNVYCVCQMIAFNAQTLSQFIPRMMKQKCFFLFCVYVFVWVTKIINYFAYEFHRCYYYCEYLSANKQSNNRKHLIMHHVHSANFHCIMKNVKVNLNHISFCTW